MMVRMSIKAFVDRQIKKRVGRGFSIEELKEVKLSFTQALRVGIPIDIRRSTKHEENVKNLRVYVEEMKLKPDIKEKKEKFFELTEVKGIGSKTANQLREGGIITANQLASSNTEEIMNVTGFSKKKASKIIVNAKDIIPG
jgi:large subunit ribosomal protein L13e